MADVQVPREAALNWLERFWTGCGRCKGMQECPLADPASAGQGADGMTLGPRVALFSAVVFLMPLATAIGGAWLVGELVGGGWGVSPDHAQAAGLAGGLLAGIAAARAMIAVMVRRRRGANSGV